MNSESAEWCRMCKVGFNSWEAYHMHKLQSKKHIVCSVCSADFNTHAGKKRHYDLMHSAAQDLKCPGCSAEFTRVGSLISHIENEMCPVISAEVFARKRLEKEKLHSEPAFARAFTAYGSAAASMVEDPMSGDTPIRPATVDINKIRNTSKASSNSAEELLVTETKGNNERRITTRNAWDDIDSDDRGNLLEFDSPRKPNIILGIDSEKFKTLLANRPLPVTLASVENFPALPKKTYKDSGVKLSDIVETPNTFLQENVAWMTKDASGKKLFPDAPKAVEPSAEILESLTLQPPEKDDQWMPHDPNNPNFIVSRYWVPFTQKYKCPHQGCRKSVESVRGFIQHLKSAAHMDEKLRCANCLRYFGSATALAQHSESQGVRCTVRETAEYSVEVDKFSAGTTIIAGRHEDNSLRYAVNKDVIRPSTSVVKNLAQVSRDASDARDKKFYNYWDFKSPDW